jgi:hypothetical protein
MSSRLMKIPAMTPVISKTMAASITKGISLFFMLIDLRLHGFCRDFYLGCKGTTFWGAIKKYSKIFTQLFDN